MAKKPFISVDGITVGEASALVNVIASNGDITTSNIVISNSANLGNVGNIYIGGGSSGQYLQTNGSGGLSWASVSGGSTSNISNGNSNVNIPTANGNVNISAVGNTTMVITGTGVNIAGTLNATGNLTAGNITTGGGSGGNITGANVISANIVNASDSANLGNSVTANYFIGSGANLTSIPAGNISGQVANALVAGTVYTAAQPNITSVGTLTGLTSNGIVNFSNTSNVSLGAVGNLHISGGSANYVLQTDGSGNLSWAAAASGSNISNGNSNVNIPTANGNINLTAVGNTTMVITGTGVNIAGTLNATGNLTAGNITTGGGSGGNITGANVISANTVTASGNITAVNANLGNAVTANYFIGTFYGTANSATTATTAGTVTTAAQPNITSVGTLTSLSVSGTGSFSGNVNLNSFNITNLATPVASTDAATKQYVDDVAQGLNVHDAAAAATPDTLANITGGTITYNNGSSGVGANLTTTGTFNLIDGVNVQTSGTRILVKNEANAVYNGIYTWSNATVITRATDYNTVPEVEAGDFIFVSGGTLYDNTGWVQTSTVTAIGTAGNNIEFTQFSGAGTYQAGTGLTLTGSTFSVNANQSQVTNVGTLGNLTVTGNATVGNLVTSGSGGTLSNINVISANTFTASGNITAGNASLGNSVTANYFVGTLYGTANLATYATTANSVAGGNVSGQVGNALVAGTVYTASQPNITSVGTLSGITSTGTANFTGASNVALGPVANVHITGGSSGQYLQTDGSGTLSWATVATGSASISNGNSNVNIPAANGNVNISAVGNANILVVTGTGVNVSGTLNVSGNTTVANLATTGSGGNISNVNVISANTFIASGNVTAGNIVTSGSGGNISNANVISANTFTASGNITAGNANLGNAVTANYFIGTFYGTANSATTATSATTAGTVTTAAQPNITSVGTLTGITSTGTANLTGASNVSLGPVANVHITGGTSGQYLQTDGSGTLSWATVSSGSTSNISNGNSNVSIATANGNITMSAVGNANIVVVTGTGVNIAGTLNATGNTTVGNLFSSGSGGNISNVNVISANTFVASGNVTAGNIVTSGSGGNISNANVISANTFTASGNITAGNANLGNAVTANYFIGNFYGTANSATSATTAGTVTTAAQPNITSVGTLSSLAVTGNITAGNANLGNNVSANFFTGNGVYLTGITTAGVSNGNSNVSIPAANGNVNISAVGNANVLVITGTGANITGTLNVTGNATVGNIVTSGSGGNVSNVNVISANTFIASGNVTAGNFITSGSGGNITGGNVISANTFIASGNITAANANLGNAVTANYFIGTLYGTANLATYATTANSVAGANVSGQVGNALVAGTVYTNAQPNITSTGTLTSLTVSGTGSFGANVNMNNYYINNLGTPSANSDAATKAYVDGLVSTGLYYHANVLVATTGTLATATGGTMTYNNGTAGVNANLVTTGTFLNIDGANVQTVGTRILVKNEANATWNGVYTYANATTIVRSTDTDTYGTGSGDLSENDYFFVAGGSVNKGTSWVCNTAGTITFGTTNINFSLFGTSQVYDAGTGLTLTNTTFSLSNTTVTSGSYGNGDRVATFTVNSQGQLTAASNTAIAANAANLTGTTLASTIVTSSLTSVGSLTGLTVSNATGVVNFTTTANVTLGAVGNLHISGGTSGQYLQTDGSGGLSWATVSSGSTSNISNGNSNVSIATANGNITFSAVGNANVMTITGTGANINGTLNTTGNVALSGANVSLGAVGNLHITGGTNAYVLSTDGAGNLSWVAASGTSIGVDNFTGNGVQTAFTLSSTPANANATLVSIAGTFQPRTVYSLAGNVITFSSAPPNTAPIEVTTFTAGSGGGGGGITAQDLLSPFLLMGA